MTCLRSLFRALMAGPGGDGAALQARVLVVAGLVCMLWPTVLVKESMSVLMDAAAVVVLG